MQQTTSKPSKQSTTKKEEISAKVVSSMASTETVETVDAVESVLAGMKTKIVELKQNVDDYSKTLKELEKAYQTIKRKNKKKIRNKKEEKPVKVSKELGKFMKLGSEGTTTRTQAMKFISNYVHDKNLQIQENKRNFRTDKDLSKLFNLKNDHELTFLQINHQLSPHFNI